MSGHTPGPWVISENNRFLVRAVDEKTGRHIANVGPANYHPSFAIDEHNARLIAAAPELLEALTLVNDCLVKCLTGGEVSAKLAGKAIEKASLVMEKARGTA